MRHYRDGKKKKDGTPSSYQSYACGRYASGGKTVCTAHIMNQRTLTNLLLLDIRYKAMLAQNSPDTLRARILEQRNAASQEQANTLRANLAALDKRLSELDKLVVSAYEDKVKGAMLEAVCIQLLNRYEAERKEKLEQRTELSARLDAMREDVQAVDDWIGMIRDYVQLEELDRPTLLRLIQRIEVGEKYELDGKTHRDIKIYYNFVGYVEI